MALTFNPTPALNATIEVGEKSWKWNGKGWELEGVEGGGAYGRGLRFTPSVLFTYITPTTVLRYDIAP